MIKRVYSNSTRLNSPSGFGLIEVLITLVILSVGLLTLAMFQSKVTEESRFNKARSEAKSLCEDALTSYRQPINKNQFDSLGNSNSTFTGTVEEINLSVQTTDTSNGGKILTATCTWGDASPDETIQITTEVSTHSLTIAALAAGGDEGAGVGLSPSLNAGASNDITEIKKLTSADLQTPPSEDFDNSGDLSAGDAVEIAGQMYIINDSGTTARAAYLCDSVNISVGAVGTVPGAMLSVESFKARRLKDSSNLFTADIELFEPYTINGTDYCVPRIRYNGGVIIPIRGTVYTGILDNQGDLLLQDLQLFTLDVSESGTYCVANDSGQFSKTYNCYVGGNCSNGPVGVDETNVFECPPEIPSTINVEGPGGWRGRVGIFGLAELDYSSCFYEEINYDTETSRSTARSYYSRYSVSGAAESLERDQGLNKPQLCQDFLIVDTQSNNTYSNFSSECRVAALAFGNPNFATKVIQRDIIVASIASSASASNTFDATPNLDFCSTPSYSINATVSGAVVSPSIFMDFAYGSTACQVVTPYTNYQCNFDSSESYATLKGVIGSETVVADSPCDLLTLTAGVITGSDGSEISQTATGVCQLTFTGSSFATDPTYNVTGEISAGISAVFIRLDSGNVIQCDLNTSSDPKTYDCTFKATDSEITAFVEATAANNYELNAPQSIQLTLDSSGPTATPSVTANFSATAITAPPTFRVSGTVSGPNIGGNSPAITVNLTPSNTNVVDCYLPSSGTTISDWNSVTSEAYYCDVDEGETISLEFKVSPQCNGNKSLWAIVTDAGGSTTGADSGAVTYSNISSPISNLNFTIAQGGGNTCTQ